MIKAAFFDIDGTLTSFKTHTIPESTKRALAALRAAGIATVISTGRNTFEMLPETRTGFDAYITMNGQYCFDDQGVFRDSPIDESDVRAIVEQARGGAYDLVVLQRDRAFVNARGERVLANEREVGLTFEVDSLDRALEEPVYQLCPFISSDEEEQVHAATRHVSITRWTELFCDVVPASGGKGVGVAAVLDRLGVTPEEAVAFGDGENDLPMFRAVGCAVAMGNAWDSVKAEADHVTTSVDDDGIWNACRHLGLV
ncbi:MAG: Cof-type HAD-IIB family hydrolase [Coriobacteriaceae bacterium]|nr:Cof-type HAD-IIB family hydrolase [Coriobacteriaceae bacterium]